MKSNGLITAMAVVLMCTIAWNCAGAATNGEMAWQPDGMAAKVGQATNDHLFVREIGADGAVIDDQIKFDQGDTKLVWLWLDDDAIYNNAAVQALTPTAYNSAGDLYNEITYNSFQCDLYLPATMRLVGIEDEDGNEVNYVNGGRLPNSAIVEYGTSGATKIIDGVKYNVYTVMSCNSSTFGTHFSSRNGILYQRNGALKKDDAALVGLYLKMDGAASVLGEIGEMIIANLEFGFREAFTADPMWSANEYRFFYGTGGNNTTQRFQYYHRVAITGGGEPAVTPTPTISSIVTTDAVTITATGEGMVTLQVDGVHVDNPCSIARGEQDVTVVATATAQAEGMLVSEPATATVLIPAKPEELPSGNNLAVPSSMLAQNGTTFDLPVSMNNEQDITALQCDVFLPNGFNLAQDAEGHFLIELVGDRATASHTVSARLLADGVVRVLITSPSAQAFTGHSGELFNLRVDVAREVDEGPYEVSIGNIILADVNSATYNAPAITSQVFVKAYQLGDANGDGNVNVGDYVAAANFILEMHPDPFIFSAADIDGNSIINVGDLVGITTIAMDQ